MSSLSSVQRFLSNKMKLVKTLLPTQLKHTNLEIDLIFQTASSKGFNDTVSQHFQDELKH